MFIMGGTPHIPVEGKNNNQQGPGKVGRVGTPHMKMCSDVHQGVGTPHMKMGSDVHHRVGTPHMKMGSDVHQMVGDAAHENVFSCLF